MPLISATATNMAKRRDEPQYPGRSRSAARRLALIGTAALALLACAGSHAGLPPASRAVSGYLVRNSYLGSTSFETAYGIVEAPDGTYYVTGATNSRNFPGTEHGAQRVYGGGESDIFVAHFSRGLKRLLQATYVGGPGEDVGYGIALDPATQFVYVVGSTTSIRLPGTTDAVQPRYAGDGDTVVVRLTRNLNRGRLTYLGGSGNDTPNSEPPGSGRSLSIAISPENGNIYVAGFTSSTDFPGTAGGAQHGYGGGPSDAYAAILTPDLAKLVQATYVGGSGADITYGMTLVPGHGVYLVGATTSSDFPGTARGAQETLSGAVDCFVTHLDSNLHGTITSTYFGGTGEDEGRAVAVDPNSETVYVSGYTYSYDLPDVEYGAQSSYGGNGDAFVAALSLDLSQVSNASYLGGSSGDRSRPGSLVLNPATGAVYVGGITASTDFPATAGGVQGTYPGDPGEGYDTFISELTSDLTQITQSTYLGGSTGHTGIHGLVVDPATGQIIAAFGTGASDIPNTAGAYQPYFAGGIHDAGIGAFPPDLRQP